MSRTQRLLASTAAVFFALAGPASADVFNPDSCPVSSISSSYTPISIPGTLRNTSCLQNTDASRNNKTVSLRLHYNDGASGQRGVVIYSHGGDPRAVCSFPANGGWPEAFARAGFVVVEVVHSQTTAQKNYACGQLGYSGTCNEIQQAFFWNRPKDIQYVLDNLSTVGNGLNDVNGQPMINRMDVTRIGVAGHSNGAYTTEVIAGAQPKMGPSETNQNFKYVGDTQHPAPLAYLALSLQGNEDHGFYFNNASDNSWQFVVSPAGEERPLLAITGYDDCVGVLPSVCHDSTLPLNAESSLNRATAYDNMANLSGVDDKMLVWVDVAAADHSDFNLNPGNSAYDGDVYAVVSSAGVAWFDAMLNGSSAARTYLRSDNLKSLMPAGATLDGDASAIDICRANLAP